MILKASKQLQLLLKVVLTEEKVNRQRWHVTADTIGNLLFVKIHAANIHDTVSGGKVFTGTVPKFSSIEGVCDDASYHKTFENHVTALGKTVTLSKKIKPIGRAILPKRLIVERTFSWLNRSKRLSKDYEIAVASEEAIVILIQHITNTFI